MKILKHSTQKKLFTTNMSCRLQIQKKLLAIELGLQIEYFLRQPGQFSIFFFSPNIYENFLAILYNKPSKIEIVMSSN